MAAMNALLGPCSSANGNRCGWPAQFSCRSSMAGLGTNSRSRSGVGAARCHEEQGGDAPSFSGPRLGSVLKAKQQNLQAQLSSFRTGELEERLSLLEPSPAPYRLLDTIAGKSLQGKATVVAEISRLSPSEPIDKFSKRCAQYVEWGADALAVCTEEGKSPNGAMDLAAACAAVNVPVLRKDWILHPLQVAETREAGASALTVVYSVLRKGTPAILQYAVSLGLDVVLEVINLQELEDVAPIGIPLYGINLSVGLSLPIPGLRQDIAKSLVGKIPFGAFSIVAVRSTDEARAMRLEGADAIYVRHEVLQGCSLDGKLMVPEAFFQTLQDVVSGDD